ncbi:MAG: AraC family transcriptional regulator [Clostridia bacterium]|nr:AraC family transcriptional regulator [Clostridia bacterium]
MSYYEKEAEEKGYGYFKHRALIKTLPHFHGTIEFLFVEKGEVDVAIGNEKRLLKGGDAAFVDSFKVHSYLHGENAEGYIFLGDKSFFDGAFRLLGNKVPPTFFKFTDFGYFENLLSIANETLREPTVFPLIYEGLSHILIAGLAKDVAFVDREIKNGDALMTDILSYAEKNYTGDLSLKKLSEVFGYSTAHISRVIHARLSENWTAYVGRLRAHKARDIIRSSPDVSVIGIGFECGFESINTFYRAYKDAFGVPPGKDVKF